MVDLAYFVLAEILSTESIFQSLSDRLSRDCFEIGRFEDIVDDCGIALELFGGHCYAMLFECPECGENSSGSMLGSLRGALMVMVVLMALICCALCRVGEENLGSKSGSAVVAKREVPRRAGRECDQE